MLISTNDLHELKEYDIVYDALYRNNTGSTLTFAINDDELIAGNLMKVNGSSSKYDLVWKKDGVAYCYYHSGTNADVDIINGSVNIGIASSYGYRKYFLEKKSASPLPFDANVEITETTNTSLTLYVNCNVGDLVVASVIARDSGNHTASSGWNLLGTSQAGNSNQTLSFYYKIATSTSESITITQSASARIYISLCAFKGKTTATMGTFSFNATALSRQITLPNKLCLVSASSNLWSNAQPYSIWSYTSTNDDNICFSLDIQTQSRLGTWIDYGGGGNKTITTPISDATGNTLIIGYVVIE